MKKAPSASAPTIVPDKLRAGDEVRVLALSRSLGGLKQFPGITDVDIASAQERLESFGLRVSFGQHVQEADDHLTTYIEARLNG